MYEVTSPRVQRPAPQARTPNRGWRNRLPFLDGLASTMAAIVWLSPLGFNSEGGQQASVVPAAMDFKAQAPRMQTVQAYKQTQMSLEGWEPLMPTLFLPAAPKSATTWLYGCMSNTFGSDQLCPVNSTAEAPSSWKACDKKFFMPAHVCNRDEGRCHEQKEAFWFQNMVCQP